MKNKYKVMLQDLQDRVKFLEDTHHVEKCLPKEDDSLGQLILNQSEFYNGNGQLNISEITLSKVREALVYLEANIHIDTSNNIFYLRLFNESWGDMSGSIYQSLDIGVSDRLWCSFDRITL